MGERPSSYNAADRDTLVSLLITLSKKLERERDSLADRIKYLNENVYRMKMEHNVELLKAEFLLGLKEREAFIYKRRYEETNDEFADYRGFFDLSQKCLATTSTSGTVNVELDGRKNKALQDEVRKLKTENSAKNSEISALVSEKTFVSNQLKTLENDLTQRLKDKDEEVKCSNEKVRVLGDQLGELQSTSERLRSDFAKIESESNQKTQDISRLLKEIELLKSSSQLRSSLLRPCQGKRGISGTTAQNSCSAPNAVTMKRKFDPSSTCQEMASPAKPSAHKSTGGKAPRNKLCVKRRSVRSTRRAEEDVITISDTRLFSSSFKVPKLKRPSPRTA